MWGDFLEKLKQFSGKGQKWIAYKKGVFKDPQLVTADFLEMIKILDFLNNVIVLAKLLAVTNNLRNAES